MPKKSKIILCFGREIWSTHKASSKLNKMLPGTQQAWICVQRIFETIEWMAWNINQFCGFGFFFFPLIDSRVQKEITLLQTILQHKYKDVNLKDGQEINFKISIIEFLVEDFR